nr:MAG TPA: minor capsid protein [Caudoviricetes sp.]
MLTPDYFYGKSDKLVEMYQELEDWIIKDIAMRLMKSGELSGTADRELWKLQQMGLHNTEIVKKISQMTGKSRDEVRRLLRDSVMTSFSDDADVLEKLMDIQTPLQNNAAIMAMNAEMMKTFGELSNLTRTTMMQTQTDLLNMLNEVDYRVASGMQSYSSAVCVVLDRYAQSGVVIDYPTGARRSLEAAVRCCIVTSMNQTAAQVTNQYIAQGGIEYVLVSAHMGARHDKKHPEGLQSHDHWQGKVYKIVGRDEDTPNLLEATGYSIDPATGQGKVVNPLGLHGYNCRHSHKPWDKSLRNPYVDADGNPKIDVHESQELYEKQQQQRGMERAIRQTKRELLAKQQELNGIAETDVKEMLQPQYDQLAYKLRMQNKKYHEYCEANDLQTQADRIKVAGFKKKQSATANGRATAYENQNKQKRIPQIPASSISEKIQTGQYSIKLSAQQFDKHVVGTAKYQEYLNTRLAGGGNPQSIISISKEDAQKIIENKAGTGIIKVDAKGNARPQEQITCDNIIGQYYYDGKYVDTNKAVIHYGKKNSHIVPVRGDNYD